MIPFLRRRFPPPLKQRSGNHPPPVANTAPAVTPVRHYFEALNVVDHRTPIPATGLYVHRLLSKFNRLQLASVARYLWDNVGLVFYATDLVAGDIPTVPEGHELKQVNTPSAPASNIEVISYLAGCFVAGMGLPPAFFPDETNT